MSDDPHEPGWASPGGDDQPARDPWGNPLPDTGGPPPADRPPGPPPGYGQPPPGQGAPPPAGAPQWEQPLSQWDQQPGSQPAWGGGYPTQQTTEGMAVGALVSGILGLVCGLAGCLGLAVGPIGVGLGIAARRKIRDSQGALKGDGLALAGIICGAIGLTIGLIWLIVVIANPDLLEEIQDQLTTTTTR